MQYYIVQGLWAWGIGFVQYYIVQGLGAWGIGFGGFRAVTSMLQPPFIPSHTLCICQQCIEVAQQPLLYPQLRRAVLQLPHGGGHLLQQQGGGGAEMS